MEEEQLQCTLVSVPHFSCNLSVCLCRLVSVKEIGDVKNNHEMIKTVGCKNLLSQLKVDGCI